MKITTSCGQWRSEHLPVFSSLTRVLKACRCAESFFFFFFPPPNYQKLCVTQIPVSLHSLPHCTQQNNLPASGANATYGFIQKNIKIVHSRPRKQALGCFAVSKVMNRCREIVSVRRVIRGERWYDVQWGFRLFWWVTQRLPASFRLLTQQVLLAKLTDGWLPLTVHQKYKCQWIKFDSRRVKGNQLAQSFPPFL